MKGDPQTRKMNSKYEHSAISNEREREREREKANGISCMNPYPMKNEGK